MKASNWLTLILLVSFPIMGIAQDADYHCFLDNPNKEKEFLSQLNQRLQQDLSSLSGNNKKYIAELYKERFETIRKKVDQKEIITNPEVQSYLEKITAAITSRNADKFPGQMRIFFSRAGWPNAASMGEGTIIFNIGLFHRLDNEAQAAFVIAHELAHYYLNHSNNAIRQYVETVNSDLVQKQLKEIHNSSYRQNSEAEKLALKLSFGSRRHSREFERAADSMAVEFLRVTDFDLSECITTLSLLDSVDKDKYQVELNLQKTFDFPEYAFKKKWLESSDLSFVETDAEKKKKKELHDSLKTHPDCANRISIISPLVNRYRNKNSKRFVVDENEFKKLKSDFDFEILEYLYSNDDVSECLYHTLQMLHFQREPYLMGMVGKCLNRLYSAQLTHELGKITDLPNPEFDAEYNNLLRMIQNLRLTEMASIAYYYLKANQESGKTSEEFVAALIVSKDNAGKPEEKSEWIEYYHSHFKNRKYNY